MKSSDFIKISNTSNLGVINNINFFKNEVSPFSDVDKIPKLTKGELYVDQYYGLPYDIELIDQDYAIYGKTDELPNYSVDHLADMGFLRVPFRKIPRIKISTHHQLLSFINNIKSQDEDLMLLFRGQSEEYLLNRNCETRNSLYGDQNVKEPSLLPSSSRKGIELNDYLGSWWALIHDYLVSHLGVLKKYASPNLLEDFSFRIENMSTNYMVQLFSMAMAQHYGIPSRGLDLTNDIEVALFFALNKYLPQSISINKAKYVSLFEIEGEHCPVIYLLSLRPNHYFDYKQFFPNGLALNRPNCQKAFFSHSGWGLNQNNVATRLFAALYLDINGFKEQKKQVGDLFPKDDAFFQYITQCFYELPDDAILKKYLTYIYGIEY